MQFLCRLKLRNTNSWRILWIGFQAFAKQTQQSGQVLLRWRILHRVTTQRGRMQPESHSRWEAGDLRSGHSPCQAVIRQTAFPAEQWFFFFFLIFIVIQLQLYKFQRISESPTGLSKQQLLGPSSGFPIQLIWGEAWGFAFLIQLVWGAHSENDCSILWERHSGFVLIHRRLFVWKELWCPEMF